MTRTLLLTLAAVSHAAAGEMTASLDVAARPRLLDTHFARYGPAFTRTVGKCPGGVRLSLPADMKNPGQVGVYSYFAAAGDFEVTATYELVSLPAPQGGYGAAVGLALDADKPADGSIAVHRGHHPEKGPGYWATRVKPGVAATDADFAFFPCFAKTGRLVLRREKTEVVCLTTDTPSDPLRELARFAFTAGTVRPLRVFADAGGSPTPVDVRVTALRVRAEELAGGIPEIGREGDGWWLRAVGAAVLAAGGVWWWRRK